MLFRNVSHCINPTEKNILCNEHYKGFLFWNNSIAHITNSNVCNVVLAEW